MRSIRFFLEVAELVGFVIHAVSFVVVSTPPEAAPLLRIIKGLKAGGTAISKLGVKIGLVMVYQ